MRFFGYIFSLFLVLSFSVSVNCLPESTQKTSLQSDQEVFELADGQSFISEAEEQVKIKNFFQSRDFDSFRSKVIVLIENLQVHLSDVKLLELVDLDTVTRQIKTSKTQLYILKENLLSSKTFHDFQPQFAEQVKVFEDFVKSTDEFKKYEENFRFLLERMKEATNSSITFQEFQETLLEIFKWLYEYVKAHPFETLSIALAFFSPFIVEGLLRLIGFTSRGVAIRTIAAWAQRFYRGNIPKGSIFSYLQAVGALGVQDKLVKGAVVSFGVGATFIAKKINDRIAGSNMVMEMVDHVPGNFSGRYLSKLSNDSSKCLSYSIVSTLFPFLLAYILSNLERL